MLDDYWQYSAFTLFMILTFEATVEFSRLKSLGALRGVPNRAIKEYERMWKIDDDDTDTDAKKMSCKVNEAAAAASSGAVLSEEEYPIPVVSSSNNGNAIAIFVRKVSKGVHLTYKWDCCV